MKIIKFATCALLTLITAATVAQQPHAIVFYNVENFFDTVDGPNRDEEYLPGSSIDWTQTKYDHKLSQVERVLFDIASYKRDFPVVIGLSEIENRTIMESIASTPKLSGARYEIVHYDSPDKRGVDVAFLYRPDIFKLEGSAAIHSAIKIEDNPGFKTRDLVTMWGTIEEQPFFFVVMHWSSRWGGAEQSEFLRVASGTQTRAVVDSVKMLRPDTRFVLMGDFNDDPVDKSMYECLGAKGDIKDMGEGDLFNPYYKMYKAGYGTLAYGDKWNIFDNIVVSRNLIDGAEKTLQLQPSLMNKKYYGNIHKAKYMIQQEGKFKGYPLRSFSGGAYIGGFSDHLPVFIYLD
ncbi:MAG: endonuclease/exonuclease/phosphatase family protein [Rikenellaceae bacterium]